MYALQADACKFGNLSVPVWVDLITVPFGSITCMPRRSGFTLSSSDAWCAAMKLPDVPESAIAREVVGKVVAVLGGETDSVAYCCWCVSSKDDLLNSFLLFTASVQFTLLLISLSPNPQFLLGWTFLLAMAPLHFV